MANHTSLPLAQPQREVKRNQIQGLFEDTIELIVGGQGSFVNEGAVTSPSYESDEPIPEYAKKSFSSGEMKGFQTSRRLEDMSPKMRSERLEEEQLAAWRQNLAKAPIQEKREEINKLLSIGNVAYTGTVNDQGEPTLYHGNEADKKAKENIALQILQGREAKLVQGRPGRQTSTKGAVGAVVDPERDFENRNLSGSPG